MVPVASASQMTVSLALAISRLKNLVQWISMEVEKGCYVRVRVRSLSNCECTYHLVYSNHMLLRLLEGDA